MKILVILLLKYRNLHVFEYPSKVQKFVLEINLWNREFHWK